MMKHIQKFPVFNLHNLARSASTKSSRITTLRHATPDSGSLDRCQIPSSFVRSRSLSPNVPPSPFLPSSSFVICSPVSSCQQLYKNSVFSEASSQRSVDNLMLLPTAIQAQVFKQKSKELATLESGGACKHITDNPGKTGLTCKTAIYFKNDKTEKSKNPSVETKTVQLNSSTSSSKVRDFKSLEDLDGRNLLDNKRSFLLTGQNFGLVKKQTLLDYYSSSSKKLKPSVSYTVKKHDPVKKKSIHGENKVLKNFLRRLLRKMETITTSKKAAKAGLSCNCSEKGEKQDTCKLPGHKRTHSQEKDEENCEEDEEEIDEELQQKMRDEEECEERLNKTRKATLRKCENNMKKRKKNYCQYVKISDKKTCVLPGGKPDDEVCSAEHGFVLQHDPIIFDEIFETSPKVMNAFYYPSMNEVNELNQLNEINEMNELNEMNLDNEAAVSHQCKGSDDCKEKNKKDDPCANKNPCKEDSGGSGNLSQKKSIVEEGCKRFQEKHKRKSGDDCMDKKKKDPCEKKKRSDKCKKDKDPCKKKKKKSGGTKRSCISNSGGGGNYFLSDKQISLGDMLKNKNFLESLYLQQQDAWSKAASLASVLEMHNFPFGSSVVPNKEVKSAFPKQQELLEILVKSNKQSGDICEKKRRRAKSDFPDDCLNKYNIEPSMHQSDASSCIKKHVDSCVVDPCSKKRHKPAEDHCKHKRANIDPCSYSGPRLKRDSCNPDDIPEKPPCKKASGRRVLYYQKNPPIRSLKRSRHALLAMKRLYSKTASCDDEQDPSAKMAKAQRKKFKSKKRTIPDKFVMPKPRKPIPKFEFKCPQPGGSKKGLTEIIIRHFF